MRAVLSIFHEPKKLDSLHAYLIATKDGLLGNKGKRISPENLAQNNWEEKFQDSRL